MRTLKHCTKCEGVCLCRPTKARREAIKRGELRIEAKQAGGNAITSNLTINTEGVGWNGMRPNHNRRENKK